MWQIIPSAEWYIVYPLAFALAAGCVYLYEWLKPDRPGYDAEGRQLYLEEEPDDE